VCICTEEQEKVGEEEEEKKDCKGRNGGVWGKGGRGTLTHAHTRTRTHTHPHSPLLLHFTDLGCNGHFFWRRRSGYISIDREDLQVSWRP